MTLRAYGAALLIPLLGVVTLNEAVDAGGTGAVATTERLAHEQRPSDLIVSPLQLERRVIVRALVERGEPCADVIVLGSSTVGHIADGMIPGKRVRNAYLSGPSIEDFEAFTSLLHHSQCHPRTIVFGADPWWLGNAQIDERRWMALVDDYLDYHAELGVFGRSAIRARVLWSDVEEKLNFTTTRESAKLLLGRMRGTTTLGPRMWTDGIDSFCPTISTEHYVVAWDGHNISCPIQIPSPAEREQIAIDYLARNTHSMGEWRDVATERVERFEKLVADWRKTGIHVVIVGMPYHPTVYRNIMATPRLKRNLLELDERLGALVGPGVEFISLRDAATVPVTPDDFEDSHHLLAEGVQKVVNALQSRSVALSSSP